MQQESHNINKYAEALLLMAEARGRIGRIESDLIAVADAIASNPDIIRFLADEFVLTAGKQEALAEIFSDRADPLLVMFIRMLQVEGDISKIAEVSKVFSGLIAAKEHRVAGEVVSAIPLSKEYISQIEEQTSLILKKEVSLSPTVDTDMLGGIIVRVGNFVIDGSLDTELAKAKSALSG